MRKYRGLTALFVICTIIGGVYAVWTYAEGRAKADDTSFAFDLASSATVSKGSIVVETNTLKITLDDADGNHKCETSTENELIVSGEAKIKFSPALVTGAPDKIMMVWKLEEPGMTFNGEKVFTLTPGAACVAVNGGVECDEFTISASDIKALVQSVSLSLPDSAAYNAFNESIGENKFKITISEAESPAP